MTLITKVKNNIHIKVLFKYLHRFSNMSIVTYNLELIKHKYPNLHSQLSNFSCGTNKTKVFIVIK